MATPPRRDPGDPYAVLGVPATASDAQVTAAFRALVRALHPDAAPGTPGAREELDRVVAAYALLHDVERRAAYDAAHARPAARPRPAPRPVPRPDPFEPPLRAGPVRVEPLRGRDDLRRRDR
ncbi:J domain-containing protein [Streptomyces sp. NPDC045431]|uniref:J domain-containing protein n=1 Tax=Streptomyces sp. NPDC045431 TaxID=3155613 RepID=UPI003410E889